MLKKSTTSISWSAITAAEGISTMIPTGTASSKAIPSCSSDCFVCCRILFAACTSSSEAIIGYMMRALPKAEARRIARSWVMNRSGCCRQIRIAR